MNWAEELAARERVRCYCVKCGDQRVLPFIEDYEVWLYSTPSYVCERCITFKELAE